MAQTAATNTTATPTSTDASSSPYNYVPTEWICILYVALFGVSTALHLLQAMKFRMWWLLPTVVLAGIMELLGWSARLWSSINPVLLTPFEIQLVGTILAPTPFIAANFLIVGRIIVQLGPQYSRLSPKLYAILFCSFDLICLVIQAVGGAIAADAVNTNGNPNDGGNIMLIGVAIQMFAMTLYVICAGEFFVRFLKDCPIRKNSMEENEEKRGVKLYEWDRLKLLVFSLFFETVFLFVRSVYRTIELENGWSGVIISTQVYFNVFDGAMLTLAMFTMNLVHPGFFLRPTVPSIE
ncbi:RTA1 like protein-domain-containing protein [Scleroderma yunnanense]